MKKEVLTVNRLVTELRMSQKSTQCACRKREIPMQLSVGSLVVALGYI
jgi:hypothetical protein